MEKVAKQNIQFSAKLFSFSNHMIATKSKVYLLQIEIVIGLFKYILLKLLRMYYTTNKMSGEKYEHRLNKKW